MKLLFYCTKSKPELFNTDKGYVLSDFGIGSYYKNIFKLNGKIVCVCDCKNVDLYELDYFISDDIYQTISVYDSFESRNCGKSCYKTVITSLSNNDEIINCKLLKDSCLSFDELFYYGFRDKAINNIYALYLSNLKTFMISKELSDYGLTKAPENMMIVYDKFGNKYILISIKSLHLFNILRGNKTIEVRRKIVKDLKRLIKCN